MVNIKKWCNYQDFKSRGEGREFLKETGKVGDRWGSDSSLTS